MSTIRMRHTIDANNCFGAIFFLDKMTRITTDLSKP